MSNPGDIDLSPADILVGSMTLVFIGGLIGSFLKLWSQNASTMTTLKMFMELYSTRHEDLERRLRRLENGGHPLE